MDHYVNQQFMDNPSFPFRAFRAPVTTDYELHTHDFVEIIYVTEGQGIHLFQDQQFLIREGDIFIIHRHVPHGYKRLPGTPLTVNNIIFDPYYFEQELSHMAGVTAFIDFYYVEPFLREKTRNPSVMNIGKLDRMEALAILDRLVYEDTNRQANYELMVRAHIMQLFIYLSRCYERSLKKPMTAASDENALIRNVCDFTRQHYAKPLSLQQLSTLCNLSQTAFTTKFKQHIGMTFIEFRNHIRLQEAKKLLETTSGKIMSIALEVGFEDLSFFNRMFKRQFGVTPSEYRTGYWRESS
ncbi:AraC family transcriptional regulator [Paenibacillus sp. BC26]|uniref:AraC family transcriptional regulator n=1 Tax=Paenibacillus sp. BC26 TaxID=1881032 RepID=UPI0008E48388|nr:AraC family transcriptional regulator [Paenibacillus sp. BC26]SFS49359.1 AraC family transcriptional regulator, L-rhamnose operon regulatory protein RhaS [Paenibacillus sp. BC26]